MEGNKKLIVDIPISLHNKLKAKAAKEGITMTDKIVKLLKTI